MKDRFLILVALLVYSFSSAQPDTILVYDVYSQTVSTILPVSFNTLITADHTSSSKGSMSGQVSLPQMPPTSNTYTNSSFSKPAKASDFFKLTDYPIRTAIHLRTYDDTSSFLNTGIMVGPCMVLTTAYAYIDFSGGFLHFDSLSAFPAFTNGQPQAGLPASPVVKIYLFKNFFNDWTDIALLQLQHPIGTQIGWTGIGFNSNQGFTSNKVFHKFSYPDKFPWDSTSIYNGDTLCYNYGYIEEISSDYLGVSQATGLLGQGGSSFLYQDNNDFYSVGLLDFSSGYLHYRLNNKAFYQMKNVLEMQTCATTSVGEEISKNHELKLYPNPVEDAATLEFEYDPSYKYELSILDILGKQIGTSIPVEGVKTVIHTSHLAPGSYIIRLRSGEKISSCKMMVN